MLGINNPVWIQLQNTILVAYDNISQMHVSIKLKKVTSQYGTESEIYLESLTNAVTAKNPNYTCLVSHQSQTNNSNLVLNLGFI